MSKKVAGEVGSNCTFQMASGREHAGVVVMIAEDGFVQLDNGEQLNLAHVESIALIPEPEENE